MRRMLIAVLLLMLAPLATAQVYKWTDASGTVHYSEAPPAQGTKFEKVTTTGTVEPLAPAPVSETSGSKEPPAQAAAEPVADTPDNRAKLCSTLQTNISALRSGGPVVMQQAGKAVALDEAQRKQQIDSAQAQYNQFCEQAP